jgi:enoyl-CoA hydratase/carnithine racemase
MTPDEFTELTYEVAEGVAVITLSRPDLRNAWSGAMAAEYRWALHHAHEDPGARVVVLTGAGGDFCAGAHTRRLDSIDADGGSYQREEVELPPYPDGTPDGLRHNHCAPLTISTPVIAAIEGACAGAGFVLATYADLRWVADDAKVTSAFARLGLPAEYGMSWMLARQVGTPNALQLLLDPEVRRGPDVLALGWAQRVLPAGTVLEEAVTYARKLAHGSSPQSLAMMKRAAIVDAAGSLDEAYRRSVEDMDAALRHPDLRRGLAAQKARRVPDYLDGA